MEEVKMTAENKVLAQNGQKVFDADQIVLSLSGGMDSTCLLMYWLAQGKSVHAYSFDYGQRHKIELKKVKKNIKYLQGLGMKVDHAVINLRSCFSTSASSLRGYEDIPHGNYDDDNMKSTVVENRNIIFSAIVYGKALSLANRTQKNVIISLGLHSGDHAIYPDCRPESQKMAAELFKISNWGSERVDYETPFNDIDKGGVLARGIEAMQKMNMTRAQIKKVLKNTHTCYDPDDQGRSCGKCGSCTERIEAFAKVGLFMDPVEYQDEEYAKNLYAEKFMQFHPDAKKVKF